MLFKKDMLFSMINEKNIKGFTIIGKPKLELIENYFSQKDLVEFLKNKSIGCNIYELDRTDIGIYFPTLGPKQCVDVCSISVSRLVEEDEYKHILDLFDDIYDYYQVNVPSRIINKVVGLYENEPLTFNDMIMLIPDNQSEVARKIKKSRQLIADVKSEKSKLTINNLSALMNEYPLLPWNEFIEGIAKSE